MSDPVTQFMDAISAAGLSPPKIALPDGKLHRFASNGDASDKAGWYILHLDGVPAGAFGDFRSGLDQTWRADIDRKLSPQELADCKARVDRMRRQREAEDAKVKAGARKEAVEIWGAAGPAPGDHPYLARKGVKPRGLRVHEGRLVVPMLDDAGVLHSLQYIAAAGAKWFLTGGRVAGCFYQIGEPRGVICVGEGFATMATVHEATGHAVVAAINKSSLLAAAQSFRRRFPAAKIVLCADDDWMQGNGNPGLTDARAAAAAVGGVVAVPEFGEGRSEKDTDFNDMARAAGNGAVRDRVEKALGGKPPRKSHTKQAAEVHAEAKTLEQWTELGNAHRLVRRHGEDVRYVHPLKAWFIWDGVFWRRDDSGDIMRRSESTIEAIFDEAKEIAGEEIRTAFRKFALKSQSNAQIRAMIQLAQHNLRVVLSPDALDANAMLLGVLNGTVDLNTGAFRDGRREDYITKQCHVAFDQAAQCPNWIKFQNKISGGNADLVAYKQRLFGLLLTGEMVEILFILHGAGQNGKSTEFETISGLLGDYAHATDAQVLLSQKERAGATPEIVAVKGKRAVFINETGESDHLNESRVKYLCGNDTMSGRNLYEGIINFRPTHKTLLRTNHKPKIRGTDLGIWRRIHYVPYHVTIKDEEKVEKFRETKLDPERPGILNWMLAGLKDYLAGGLKPSPVVCKATKEYRREMDTTGQWIEAMCEPSTIGAKLRLSTLYKSYSKWAIDEVGAAVSRQKLAEALRERGFESVLEHGVTVFKNIRLHDEEAEPY